MNILRKHMGMKLVVLLAVLLSASRLWADPTLAIDAVTFNSYDVQNVPVLLDNEDAAVAALQFDLTLPSWLEFAGKAEKNSARLLNGHSLTSSLNAAGNNMRVMVSCQNKKPFEGTSGAILYIPVKVKAGMLTANGSANMEMSGITMNTFNASQTWKQEAFKVAVTTLPYTAEAYVEPTEMVLNPGNSTTVSVGVKNNFDIAAMTLEVVLPEGFTMGEEVVNSSRVAPDLYIQVFQNPGNLYRLVVADIANNKAISGRDGIVLTFTMTAPADFAAETATVSVKRLEATYGENVNGNVEFKTIVGTEAATVTITNGKKAYDAAMERIAALESALATALETIATDDPDVKDNFTGAEIATEIAALKAAVEADYDAVALNGTFEAHMAEATKIAGEIDALVAAAAEAQAAYVEAQRKAANEAAYAAVTTEINGLQTELDAAVAAAAEQYPNADLTETTAAAQAAITAARDGAKAAFDAVATEGTFSYTVDADAIRALIAAIATKAAADTESARVAANDAAYQASLTEIEALQTELDRAVAAVEEQYTDGSVNIEAEKAAAQAAIDAAKTGAQQAYAAVAEEGVYNYVVPAEAITALVEAIATKAEADYTEAQRVAANAAAYQVVADEFDALQANLTAALAAVAEQYPDADIAAQKAAAEKAIADGRAAAQAAFEAVATEGTFEYTVAAEAIQALIDAIPAKAAADAEAARVAANKAAYDAAVAEIDALQANYTATVAAVAAEYPDADLAAAKAAAEQAIADARAAAKAAFDAVATEGAFEFTVPAEAVQALIDAIPAKAAADKEAARVAANEAAYQASLAEIAGLQNQLDALVAMIAEQYPAGDVNIDTEKTAAQAAIDAAKAGAQQAYAAVAEEGAYSYTVDAAGITALISAVASKADADFTEAQRIAANNAAYAAAIAQLDALDANLAAAVAAATEQYPDADITATKAAAEQAIATARAAAQAVYAAVATAGTFNYTVDAAGIQALIDAIGTKAAADTEAARVAANKAAYDAVVAAIDALQTKYDTTVAAVAAEYPNADVAAAKAAAQKAITDARNGALSAFNAVAATGTFAYTLDSESIETLINAIAAKAAGDAEAARVAANKAAYDVVVGKIEALQSKLNTTETLVKVQYPDADVEAETKAAQDAIDALRTAAADALAAVATEGTFEYTFDAAPVEALIAAITKKAADDKAAADAEAARVAANKAAYDAVIAKIDALQNKLTSTEGLVKVQYPDADVEAETKAAQDAIDALRTAAADALAAVATEGTFEYTFDAAPVEALIAAITKKAADDKAAADAEAARVAANKAAYDAVIAKIDALQNKLNTTETIVKVQYPGVDVDAEIRAAQDAIDALRYAADDALTAVAEEGTFEYTFDPAETEALINAIIEAARANGIEEISADDINPDLMIYDINGRRLAQPRRGEMNVIVNKLNGNVSKVIVK